MINTIYDDNELAYLLKENDENVKDLIYDKYEYLIDYFIKKYKRVIRHFNIDAQEVRAEALVGFSDGIFCFCEEKNASLKTFLSLCIERRVMKCLNHYTSSKTRFLNDFLSLDYEVSDYNHALIDTISDDHCNDPLSNLTAVETLNEILGYAKENLSKFEREVFSYMIDGMSYQQIAQKTGKSSKQISNTIVRIKNKIKLFLS